MLFLLLRILTISISKDIVSYKDQRKDNKYKYKVHASTVIHALCFMKTISSISYSGSFNAADKMRHCVHNCILPHYN